MRPCPNHHPALASHPAPPPPCHLRQELDTFKFVLEHSVAELRAQLAPRDAQLADARARLTVRWRSWRAVRPCCHLRIRPGAGRHGSSAPPHTRTHTHTSGTHTHTQHTHTCNPPPRRSWRGRWPRRGVAARSQRWSLKGASSARRRCGGRWHASARWQLLPATGSGKAGRQRGQAHERRLPWCRCTRSLPSCPPGAHPLADAAGRCSMTWLLQWSRSSPPTCSRRP